MIAKQLLDLLVDISELRQDPRNARAHPIANREAIRASLQAFGQQKPIVALPDGTVIAGNGLLWAAIELGWEKIAVVRFHGSPQQAKAYALADNRTGEMSIWNEPELELQLDELRQDFDLEALGFELDEPEEEKEGGGGDGENEPKGPGTVAILFEKADDAKLVQRAIDAGGMPVFARRVLDLARALDSE